MTCGKDYSIALKKGNLNITGDYFVIYYKERNYELYYYR